MTDDNNATNWVYVLVLITSNIAALCFAIRAGVSGAFVEYKSHLNALAEEISTGVQLCASDGKELQTKLDSFERIGR